MFESLLISKFLFVRLPDAFCTQGTHTMGCVCGPRENILSDLPSLIRVPGELSTLLSNLRQTGLLRGAHSLFPVCLGIHSAFSYLVVSHISQYWAFHCVSSFIFYLIIVFAGFVITFFFPKCSILNFCFPPLASTWS